MQLSISLSLNIKLLDEITGVCRVLCVIILIKSASFIPTFLTATGVIVFNQARPPFSAWFQNILI